MKKQDASIIEAKQTLIELFNGNIDSARKCAAVAVMYAETLEEQKDRVKEIKTSEFWKRILIELEKYQNHVEKLL